MEFIELKNIMKLRIQEVGLQHIRVEKFQKTRKVKASRLKDRKKIHIQKLGRRVRDMKMSNVCNWSPTKKGE